MGVLDCLYEIDYNISMPGMYDDPVIFEPTFTFMGLLYCVLDVKP